MEPESKSSNKTSDGVFLASQCVKFTLTRLVSTDPIGSWMYSDLMQDLLAWDIKKVELSAKAASDRKTFHFTVLAVLPSYLHYGLWMNVVTDIRCYHVLAHLRSKIDTFTMFDVVDQICTFGFKRWRSATRVTFASFSETQWINFAAVTYLMLKHLDAPTGTVTRPRSYRLPIAASHVTALLAQRIHDIVHMPCLKACVRCALRRNKACPKQDDLHTHPDGCPSCSHDEFDLDATMPSQTASSTSRQSSSPRIDASLPALTQ